MPTHRLSLARSTREINPDNQTPRQFLDFVVDGRPMYPELHARGFDLISPLWIGEPKAASASKEAIMRLLGEVVGDAPHGRVTLYVCPECADLGCGAITVQLTRDDQAVQWRAWGYQNNYSDEIIDDNLDDLDDLTFSRAEYDDTLRQALEQFEHQ